jgi:GT2 family glycosyltransferase
MVTTKASPDSVADAVSPPSVLVVLVVRDAAGWLRESMRSLSDQTYARLGVVAVDIGSTDGSRDILEHALGAERVLGIPGTGGFSEGVRAALDLPVATAADYVLLLHDDAALAPDAVGRMVEAAEGLRGVERVGIVGPKVVDWEDPRILREVGRSTDRFGHPHTPLQDGEMDQGQYDRILEVLYVSSCAMLLSREAWQRTGTFDERFDGHHDDLDFCWRARLAGFRVLMTPQAQARHRNAEAQGERPGPRRSSRYLAERAGLASMLKNYGILSLLWLLPLSLVMGVVRLAYLAVSRRLEDAYELLSAWAWNLVHLPSTLRRRVRAQAVRTVPDRAVRRFMQTEFFRLPRWFVEAERILEEQIEMEEEPERPPVRARFASLAASHPVLVAWALGIAVASIAYRFLIAPQVLQGGVLGVLPSGPTAFLHELVSGVRTTSLGGTQAASPALGALGALSAVLFASPALAQKALLILLPPAAALVLYRSVLRQTGQRGAAVVAGATYAMSALTFWGFSQGRIDVLVALAVLPGVADRVDAAFGGASPSPRLRFAVGLGAGAAIGVAFLPGIVLPLAVLVVLQLLTGSARVRGMVLAGASAVVAAALVGPMIPDILASPAAELSSRVGTTDFLRLARLGPAGGPGSWPVALFLPVAALIGFSAVGPLYRIRAWRAVAAAAAGVFLAWASSAGYLPQALSNAPAYLVLAAASEAAVVGYGLATMETGIEREAFGYRQVAAGLMLLVLTLGFLGQAVQAIVGSWDIGPNAYPSAWPVISDAPGEFRVLWLGAPTGQPFPAPGGDPQGIVQAGPASVLYAVTDKEGVSALDLARGPAGPGNIHLRASLAELLAGDTSHGGALLSPFGVGFVVAEQGDLPGAAGGRLDDQLDLDRIPAGGLVIYRNARLLPPAFVTSSPSFEEAARSGGLLALASTPPPGVAALQPADGGVAGTTSGGFGFYSEQDQGGWRVRTGGHTAGTRPAFGWGIGFDASSGSVRLIYANQWIRTIEVILLGLLWLAVLWITRRPGTR